MAVILEAPLQKVCRKYGHWPMNMGQIVLCPVVEDAVIVAAMELAESVATMSPRVFWLRTKQEYSADEEALLGLNTFTMINCLLTQHLSPGALQSLITSKSHETFVHISSLFVRL